MRKLRFCASALALVLFSIGLTSPPSFAETQLSGILKDGHTFTKAGSPYQVTDTLLVQEGSTIRVEPGVTIIAPKNKALFWNLGSIEFNGSETEKITVIGSKAAFVKVENAPKGSSVKISHTLFDSVGKFFSGTPVTTDSIDLSISDSDFYKTLVDSWYPRNFLVERSVFLDDSGIMLGYGYNPSADDSTPALIQNNLFMGLPGASSVYGNTPSKMWINVWAAYGGPVIVRGNSFLPSKNIFLNASVDGTIDASSNYWGTTVPSQIQEYVLDKADSFAWRNYVKVDDPLAQPDALTPLKARLVKATKVATPEPKPVKYKNCAALNKVYVGGVAKSTSSVNKGGKIKQKPAINAKVYDLNKSLDRDKDGIACER